MDAPIRDRRRKGEPPAECAWDGCDKLRAFSSGLCPRHERRRKAGSPMDGPAYYHDTRGWLTEQGYRKVKRNGKDVPEHRIVMEEKLGRKLLRQEEVHHKNGIKTDNSPGNLELWVSWKGQRVEDLVAFVVSNYPDLVTDQLYGLPELAMAGCDR
jgi:HNH endonuclease